MQTDKFIGTGVALITPFTDEDKVDVSALEEIVEYQIKNDIDYLVVLGTTAESATLSTSEKELVKQTIIDKNAGRLPLVLGLGSNNTRALVEEINKTDFKDFDAILSVSPYYNKPSQSGIYAHYAEVSKASPLPIILYNVPSRTSSNISVDTVVKLAKDFDNIIGIKEATGDIVQAYDLIDKTPEGFLVISGDDMITLPMVLGGGHGVISVIGQGFPKDFSKMVKLGLKGESKAAFDIHYKIAPAINMIFEQGNPAGIKSVFKHLKLSTDKIRLPLVKVNEDLHARIKAFIGRYY